MFNCIHNVRAYFAAMIGLHDTIPAIINIICHWDCKTRIVGTNYILSLFNRLYLITGIEYRICTSGISRLSLLVGSS